MDSVESMSPSGDGVGGRGPREFEAVDAEPAVEGMAIGPNESVVVPPKAVAAGARGRDASLASGRARLGAAAIGRGGRRGRGGGDQAQPPAEAGEDARASGGRGSATNGAVASLPAVARVAGVERVLDHDEPISIGHDPPDVVPSGAELNERDASGVAWHVVPNLCKWEMHTGGSGVEAASGLCPRPLNSVGRSICSEHVRVSLQNLFGRCYPDIDRPCSGPGSEAGIASRGHAAPTVPKAATASPGATERGGGCALRRANRGPA